MAGEARITAPGLGGPHRPAGHPRPSSGLIGALLRETEVGRALRFPAEGLGPGWEELLIGLGSTGPGEWLRSKSPPGSASSTTNTLFDGVFSRRPSGWTCLRTGMAFAHHTRGPRTAPPVLLRWPSLPHGRPARTGRFWAAAPLATEWTNLAQHALLVPMALRMAETARSSGIQQFHSGEDQDLLLPHLLHAGRVEPPTD